MININQFPIFEESFLRQVSEPIKDWQEARDLKYHLFDQFPENGGYAVAAPQIGILKRATLIRLPSGGGDYLFMCNPEIVYGEEEFIFKGEGCLSFKNIYLNTKRFYRIKVKFQEYTNNDWEERTAIFENLEAVIVAHEIDHLNGILFFDREYKIEPIKRTTRKIGRNDLCPDCLKDGINIKYKKCNKHYEN